MKINIGELVNNTYNQDDVINYLASSLVLASTGLSKAVESQSWGLVGASQTAVAQLAQIAVELDHKVNGKKANPVL